MTNRTFQISAAVSWLVLALLSQVYGRQNLQAQTSEFTSVILKELLSVPPSSQSAGPLLVDDLAKVPEIHFREPLVSGHPRMQKGPKPIWIGPTKTSKCRRRSRGRQRRSIT
jgi:hypothetical protein